MPLWESRVGGPLTPTKSQEGFPGGRDSYTGNTVRMRGVGWATETERKEEQSTVHERDVMEVD